LAFQGREFLPVNCIERVGDELRRIVSHLLLVIGKGSGKRETNLKEQSVFLLREHRDIGWIGDQSTHKLTDPHQEILKLRLLDNNIEFLTLSDLCTSLNQKRDQVSKESVIVVLTLFLNLVTLVLTAECPF
jgi:hypothetical protein